MKEIMIKNNSEKLLITGEICVLEELNNWNKEFILR